VWLVVKSALITRRAYRGETKNKAFKTNMIPGNGVKGDTKGGGPREWEDGKDQKDEEGGGRGCRDGGGGRG